MKCKECKRFIPADSVVFLTLVDPKMVFCDDDCLGLWENRIK